MAIVTLSLNPTIDMMSETDVVKPIHKIRTTNENFGPGGGGVNVAKVIFELGGSAEVIAAAGGFPGRMLDDLLGRIPVPRRIVPIAGDTRISFTVFERETGQEYRFVPTGPTLSAAEIEACLEAVRRSECTWFVASGSVPPGAPPDILARVGEIAAEKGARFILDSSGPGLTTTLGRVPVYLVKPSLGEMEALVGHRLDGEAVEAAARDLVAAGHAEIVAVTMGVQGAVVVARDSRFRVFAPKIKAVSALGAGDAFVGAMTLALADGRPLDDALMLATAAGAATALTPVARVCSRAEVSRLYDQVKRENAGAAADG
jgi:6-phosphofructokinase 2